MIGGRQLILVCGSRDGYSRQVLWQTLDSIDGDPIILSGGQRGVDTMARHYCFEKGRDYLEAPAIWTFYGKPAGPRRNRLMASLRPDLVLAFHAHLERSKGTRSMLDIASELRIPVELHEEPF